MTDPIINHHILFESCLKIEKKKLKLNKKLF